MIHGNLAVIAGRMNRESEAWAHAQAGLAVIRDAGQTEVEIELTLTSAESALGEGRLDDAERCARSALALSEWARVTHHIAHAYSVLGRVLGERGDTDGALHWLHRSTEAAAVSGRLTDEGYSRFNLATFAFRNGRPLEAREALDRAMPILRQVTPPVVVAQSLLLSAQLHLAEGDAARARDAFTEAQSLLEAVDVAADGAVAATVAKLHAALSDAGQ